MAKRYIDADMLYGDMLYAMVMTGYQSKALSVIEEQPTADVQEVVHGHWIQVIKNAYPLNVGECSACGGLDDLDNYGKPTYCRHCGAKMDEEKNI